MDRHPPAPAVGPRDKEGGEMGAEGLPLPLLRKSEMKGRGKPGVRDLLVAKSVSSFTTTGPKLFRA